MRVELSVDATMFSLECVARTAHRYTDQFYVDVRAIASDVQVHLTPKLADADLSNIEGRFRNDLLDDLLRHRVRESTHELHTILLEAALLPMRSKSGDAPP